jgi:uncharacterized SAM-binding protein YcdF (DUF218 family)
MLSALASSTLLAARWTTFSWGLTEWLGRSKRVVLILLILAILPLFFRSRRWRNWVGKPAAIALAVYLFLLSPIAAHILTWGLDNRFLSWWDQPQSLEEPADAMVILGRGPQLNIGRIDVTAQLEKTQPAPIIFASGYDDAPVILDGLKHRGIPDEKLQGESCSLTTEENALFTSALLQPQGVRRILLITDPLHQLRSRLTFESYGFQVATRSSPLPLNFSSAKRSLLALREYSALISYGLMGRFQPRPLLTEIPQSVMNRIKAKHCRIEG